MVRIFWVGLLLEVFGLATAVLLSWVVSSAFGRGLNKYPVHIGFIVDLFFILFSAILAERAEETTLNYERRGRAIRSWALVGFIISVGTLAPLASHSGKTFRDVFVRSANDLQETTILSDFLCAQGDPGCGPMYFAITVVLTIACIMLALLSVFVLRSVKPGESFDKSAFPAYLSFSASIFLFGVYTLLSHKWDVSGPELTSITMGQLTWTFVSLVLGLLAFVLIGDAIVSRTRGAAQTRRHYKTMRHYDRRGVTTDAKDQARAQAAEDQARAQVKAAATSLGMWLAAVALLLLLLWMAQRNISTWAGMLRIELPTLPFYVLTLLVIALGVAALLAGRSEGSTKIDRGQGAPGHRPEVPPPPPLPPRPTPPPIQQDWLRRLVSWVRAKISRVWQGLRVRIGELPQRIRHAAVAISVVLLVCSAAFAVYEILRRLPQEGGGGKEALRPSGSPLGKVGIPALTLTRVPIE